EHWWHTGQIHRLHAGQDEVKVISVPLHRAGALSEVTESARGAFDSGLPLASARVHSSARRATISDPERAAPRALSSPRAEGPSCPRPRAGEGPELTFARLSECAPSLRKVLGGAKAQLGRAPRAPR